VRRRFVPWAWALAILCAGLAGGARSRADAWTPPDLPQATIQLPRLSKPLVLDGDLKDWAGAVTVPVRYRSYMEAIQRQHEWRGPADAGMEFYCAWDADGVCLAALVTDDDVYNDRSDDLFWQQDCVEIFLDGRVGGAFMTAPYSHGAYQILVRPPTAARPAGAWVKERDGDIEGLRVAGRRTPTGYALEVLVPWSAFPDLSASPGAEIGLQCRLDDYDQRDGDLIAPMSMTYGGARDLWISPQHFIRWVLVDRPRAGADLALGPSVAVDMEGAFGHRKPLEVSVEFGRTLSTRVGSLTVSAVSLGGDVVFSRTIKPSRLPAPWHESLHGSVEVPPELPADGYYVIRVLVDDRAGHPLGTASRAVLYVGHVAQQFLARVEAVDLPHLAQAEPFRAAAYLGAGACLEKLKRAVELHDFKATVAAARELTGRLDVLEDGHPAAGDQSLYDLLTLTANPEGQVVVEYLNDFTAVVTFYWGDLPITSATVTQFGTDAEAAAAVDPKATGTAMATAGKWLIAVQSPSAQVADRAVALVKACRPVAPSDVDAMRRELVESLAPTAQPVAIAGDRRLFCGDLHMHTFYSDGRPSPVGLVLESMYCFMDFAAISDHNTIEGARVVRELLGRSRLAYPLIISEEITTPWAHLNAYPLKEVVSWELSPYDMIKAAHVQGAVIQWNHPAAVHSPWADDLLVRGIGDTALDAWEHVPPAYDAWKKEGGLPVITGTTDTHDGTFTNAPERTIVLAPTPEGDDIAEAVRSGHAVALAWKARDFLYGADDMVAAVWSALAEGRALKNSKADQLRHLFREADLSALLRVSQPATVSLAELAPH
jgi:hypothetical protein